MIENVKSNVKGGVNATLSQRTLIVGRNASGKSAIIQSVELATSGAASDVAGRALLKLGAELQMLTPPGETKLWAEADGARFEAVAGKTPVRTGPAVRWPLREVREALLGSVETARKALLAWTGASGGAWVEQAKQGIPTVLHRRLDAISPGTTSIPAAIDEAKRRVREANAKAKVEEEHANRLAQGGTTPMTETAISSLEVKLAAAQAAEAARGFEGLRAQRVAIGLGIERAERLHREALEEHQRAVEEAKATPAVEVPRLYTTALEVIEALAAEGTASCAICGCTVDPSVFVERAARGRAKLAAVLAANGRAEIAANRLREAASILASCAADLARLRGEAERLDAALREAPMMPSVVPTETAAELRAVVSQARQSGARWADIQAARARAKENEREAREWKDLAEGLAQHLGSMVEQARVAFEMRVQTLLPKSMKFGIDLLDGDREVLRFGLRDPSGKVRAALSGAEWASVTAALAVAIGGADCIISPEERAFDPDTLSTVLASLGTACGKAQIIVASPVGPSSVPDGWTVIEMGKEKPIAKRTKKNGEAKEEKPAAEITSPTPRAAPAVDPKLASDPNFCADCNAVIGQGQCEHGKGPRLTLADILK